MLPWCSWAGQINGHFSFSRKPNEDAILLHHMHWHRRKPSVTVKQQVSSQQSQSPSQTGQWKKKDARNELGNVPWSPKNSSKSATEIWEQGEASFYSEAS